MRHSLLKAFGAATLAWTAVACTHQVAPKVTPAKLATVAPPIRAHVLLLLAPAFETYVTDKQDGLHHFVYHLGQASSTAIQQVVTGSFTQVDVVHVGDADVLQRLTAPADATKADVLLVPNFARGATGTSLTAVSADVQIRLDVRNYRDGATYSWITGGHTSRFMSSHRGLTGSAVERAMNALADTLTANRAKLEGATTD